MGGFSVKKPERRKMEVKLKPDSEAKVIEDEN